MVYEHGFLEQSKSLIYTRNFGKLAWLNIKIKKISMLTLQQKQIIQNIAFISLSFGGSAENLRASLNEQDVVNALHLYKEISGEDVENVTVDELYARIFKIFIELENSSIDAKVEEVEQGIASVSMVDYNTSPDLSGHSTSPTSLETETVSSPSDESHFEPNPEQDAEQYIAHIEEQIYVVEERIQRICANYSMHEEVDLLYYMKLFVERSDLIKMFEAKNIELMDLKTDKIDSYLVVLREIVNKERYFLDFSRALTRCYWFVIDNHEVPQKHAMLYAWAVNLQTEEIENFIDSAQDAIKTLSNCKDAYTGIDKDIYEPINYLQYACAEFARMSLACITIIQSQNLEPEMVKNNLAIIVNAFFYLKANVQHRVFEQSGIFLIIEQALETVLNSIGFRFAAQDRELFFSLLNMHGQIISYYSAGQYSSDSCLLSNNPDQDLFEQIKASYAYIANVEFNARLDPEKQHYLLLLRSIVNDYYLAVLTGMDGRDYAKLPATDECKLKIKCLSFLAMHLEGKNLDQALRCKFEYEKQYIDTLTYQKLMVYRDEVCLNTVETPLYHAYDQYKTVNRPSIVIDDEVICTEPKTEIDVESNAKNRAMLRKHNSKLLEYASGQLDLFSGSWIYTTEVKMQEMRDKATNSESYPSIPMRFNI